MMQLHVNHTIDLFTIIGVSFRKTDVQVRSQFSITEAATRQLLQEAAASGIQNLMVVSTCNRTEVYAHGVDISVLQQLFCRYATAATPELLAQHVYTYHGKQALMHLFKVNAGLDSQIIGDFEIAGQIKHAIQLSRSFSLVGPELDRAYNFVVQAAKKIKNQTKLSSGTVSVSYAAIEWLQRHIEAQPKKVLVVGAGKFGTGVVKNLLHYMPQLQVTITNRTPERASSVAAACHVTTLPFEQLNAACRDFDVVITCTNAPAPLLFLADFALDRNYLAVDLSVPQNIDTSVKEVGHVQLIGVDDLTPMLNATIDMRMAEVPKALSIIEEHYLLFATWMETYLLVPTVQEARRKMLHMQQQLHVLNAGGVSAEEINTAYSTDEYHIDEAVQHLMVNLKNHREKGCQYIAAYHSIFTSVTQLA